MELGGREGGGGGGRQIMNDFMNSQFELQITKPSHYDTGCPGASDDCLLPSGEQILTYFI